MNQAQHHQLEFTQIPASHPLYLGPPPDCEDSDRLYTAIFSTKTHTNKQHPLAHVILKALSSDRNTETTIILSAPMHTSNVWTNKSTSHYPPAFFKFRFKSKVTF